MELRAGRERSVISRSVKYQRSDYRNNIMKVYFIGHVRDIESVYDGEK